MKVSSVSELRFEVVRPREPALEHGGRDLRQE